MFGLTFPEEFQLAVNSKRCHNKKEAAKTIIEMRIEREPSWHAPNSLYFIIDQISELITRNHRDPEKYGYWIFSHGDWYEALGLDDPKIFDLIDDIIRTNIRKGKIKTLKHNRARYLTMLRNNKEWRKHESDPDECEVLDEEIHDCESALIAIRRHLRRLGVA